MNIKIRLKNLQYRLAKHNHFEKKEHLNVLAEARKYIKELEKQLEGFINKEEGDG